MAQATLPKSPTRKFFDRLIGRRPKPDAGFLRNLRSPFIHGWNPAYREPRREHEVAYYDVLRRSIDAMQNSGWLAGGVEQAAVQMCGPMLALNARPDPDLFGGASSAKEWARLVERRFAAYASSPYAVDYADQMNLGQLCHQAVKMWFGYGEILGLIQFERRPGNSAGTKLQLLPPTRCPANVQLTQGQVPTDLFKTQQGVRLDDQGRPVGYWIDPTPRDPEVFDVRAAKLIDKRDQLGRQIVIHIHDSPPTVIRGMTPLAPALQVVRQFDQLSNATLQAALIQAIFAATVESDAPTDQLLSALQDVNEQDVDTSGSLGSLLDAKASWYDRTNIDLGTFGKVVHMFVGEKLNFMRSEHPNDNYQPFARFLLLEIARCLGVTYEQLTGDWREATYTSGRMGAAENWLLNVHRRKTIAGPLMQAVYAAWLEEEIEAGTVPFPGGVAAFLNNRELATQCDWRGPPKPTADDFKTGKANEVKLRNGIITREMWCAEEGVDYDEVFEQIAQEKERAEELDIDPGNLAADEQTEAGGGNRPAGEFEDQD